MKPPSHERRAVGTAPKATGRTISGFALKFNSRSENLGTPAAPWFEELAPGCLPDLKTQDCRCLMNHDANQVLARSKRGTGSLKLTLVPAGLRYEFEAPFSTAGDDLLESVRRGDVDQSSFSFVVAPNGEEWRAEGKNRIRRITKIAQLLDVSPVAFPAYTDTSVSARHKVLPPGTGDRGQGYWLRYSAKLARNA